MKRILGASLVLLASALGVTVAAPIPSTAQISVQREAPVACYNPETKRLEPCF